MEGEGEGWDNLYEEPDFIGEYAVADFTKIKGYKGYSSDEIQERQQKIIEEVIELLDLEEDDAITALKHFSWNPEKLQEAWFDKEDETRKRGGLIPVSSLVSRNMNNQDMCYIGYKDLSKTKPYSLICGHLFGSEGWTDYLTGKLSEGYHCVFATCPYYEGPLTTTHSTWLRHLKGANKQKYINFHCKSYTDDSKNIKWGPSPGCKFCIENTSYTSAEIECDCGNTFGFKCNQDSHRPLSGEVTMKWLMKNKSESENITWMIANTKNCPKCQRPIEKNQGCNHMTCNMGKHEFCWMCMGDWTNHGSATGGYYKCNKYEEMKKDKNAFTKAEEKREKAKHELKKYMFFFERYNNHLKAAEHALEMLPKIKVIIQKLNTEKHYPIAELTFLEEALNEVIRCRKVLKWTYAYGYYLTKEDEKPLFEDAQEQLEKNGDRLHEYLEQDFEPFLNEEELDKKPFYNYKSDLVTRYGVTKTFYQNLLEGLENGLTSG